VTDRTVWASMLRRVLASAEAGPPLAPELVLGQRTGGGYCPVCVERIASWAQDARGVLVEHAGRAFPCRVRARWEPEWSAEQWLAHLDAHEGL
jgi:hypothetical protein